MLTSPRTLKTFLSIYNNVLNLTTPSTVAYVGSNLTTAAAVLRAGRGQGLAWDELGLARRHVPSGARLGGAVAATIAAGYGLALAVPQTRALLRDDRAEKLSPAQVAQWAALRIPLGTVVLEELAFRGVLYGLDRRRSPWRGAVTSSAVFALWHLVATWRTLETNDVDDRFARALGAVAGSALTAVGGLFFCALRERSGSLLAPALAHTTTNVGGALAATLSWRTGRR